MAELQKDGGSCEVTGLLGEEGEESQAGVPGLHSPQEAMEVSRWTPGLCVRAPGTSAAIYKAETRREGEVPEGTYIFQRKKKKT